MIVIPTDGNIINNQGRLRSVCSNNRSCTNEVILFNESASNVQEAATNNASRYSFTLLYKMTIPLDPDKFDNLFPLLIIKIYVDTVRKLKIN